LVFSKPLSKVSFASSVMPDSLFSDENILLKKLILNLRFCPTPKISRVLWVIIKTMDKYKNKKATSE
jgi:hypothetical protein